MTQPPQSGAVRSLRGSASAVALAFTLLLPVAFVACAPAEEVGEVPTVEESADAAESGGGSEEASDGQETGGAEDAAPEAMEPPAALSHDNLVSATFTNEMFPDAFTLDEGHAEIEAAPGSASRITADLHPEAAYGDLDGDGDQEAAAILYVSGGGSGTFRYLVAVDEVDGVPMQLASMILGDRVKIDGLAIDEGRIVIDVTTHGPDDPMCCPTQEDTLVYGLTGGELLAVVTE